MRDDASPPTDEELIARLRAGDREAFHDLFARHGAAVEHLAERLLPRHLRRRVSVADVVQEARIDALAACGEFEPQGQNSFRNWLLKVVELRAREAVRLHSGAARRAVGREVTGPDRPATAAIAARGPSPSQVAVAAEAAELAQRAFAALPEHYREVLRLHREEHVPLDQVAARTGRSYDATKKLYGRALSAFAKEFGRLRGETLG